MAEKLVRDLVPLIILKKGEKLPPMREVKDEELLSFLVKKLDEEVAELKAAIDAGRDVLYPQNTGNLAAGGWLDEVALQRTTKVYAAIIQEVADITEVLGCIASKQDVERVQAQKKEERGGFYHRVVLDFPEENRE